MEVLEYIKNCVNVKLSSSNIHGIGVFALRDIPEGEIIFKPWTGETGLYSLSENEINMLDENIKKHVMEMFEFKKINNVWGLYGILNKDCHWIFRTPYHWVNSCGWNELPNVDKETLISLRRIKSGEEILFKYGKYEKYVRSRTI